MRALAEHRAMCPLVTRWAREARMAQATQLVQDLAKCGKRLSVFTRKET